ncbi:MAG: PLP-dependent transferase [Planctomycetaceae bacterium]
MPVDLISEPRFREADLGLPMPDDLHAVSACLPLWRHNIGYEEGDLQVHSKLQAAYPRFCFHPIVQQLCDRFFNVDGRKGLPFASKQAAERAVEYVRHAVSAAATLQKLPGQSICGVTVEADHFPVLKQYWQHAGENASSRVAELILNDCPATCSDTEQRRAVRQRVAGFQATPLDDVFLFPSGMASIASAIRAVRQFRTGPICQFGFPYVDTLKILQRFPNTSHHFFPLGSAADLQKLTELCQSTPPIAVVCEVPTNPLLVTPDMAALRSLADQYGFVLIVDDTLTACGNLNLTPFADLRVTSLTKYFSGYGNVLAGALTLNPGGSHYADLRAAVTEEFEETLSDIDVQVLAENSADMQQRVRTINDNAVRLASFLRDHPQVQSVFYPSADCREYEALRAAAGGYGGLMSIVLRDAERTTPIMFDSLEVCKGPNLGTNFTLCCPYTILAHYTELDFAETCGVSRWLLRISVGTEPYDVLERRFRTALDQAAD